MQELIKEFIVEAKDLVKDLEKSLMVLEKDLGSIEEINTVFRVLHTLKGSAGMFGLTEIERLTHDLENIYADIRENIRQNDDFILDLTLHTADTLKDLLNGNDCKSEVDSIIEEVKRLRADEDGVQVDMEGKNAGSPKEASSFLIVFKPEKLLFKRGVNLTAVFEEIEELGKTEMIVHNDDIPLETQIENKEISSWFEIYLSTSEGEEEVNDVFLFMLETEYKVLPLTDSDLSNNDTFKEALGKIELSANDYAKRVELLDSITPTEKKEILEESSRQPETTEAADNEKETTEQSLFSKQKKESNISVSTKKLDDLINIVSEIVVFRSELQHLAGYLGNTELDEAAEKLERLSLKLRDNAFNIRLTPVNVMAVKIRRLIRSLSQQLGKEVEFITQGLETELDRSIISAVEAPLLHIIRNAVDHGIESPEDREAKGKPKKGLLKLFSYNSSDHVFIQIQDDGKGIDLEKVRAKGIEKGLISAEKTYSERELTQLILEPGFSTAEEVTKVSGRGVGMDVVKKDLATVRGEVEIHTEQGLGTIITLRLPNSLSVLDTLIVSVANQKYLLPISEVEYCYTENHDKLFEKKSRQIKYDHQLVPFVSLREFFEVKDQSPEEEKVIVINKNDQRVAIVVDSILGELQTVYKPLNELLRPAECFSGASILGDGSMALILNALKLNN
ncbi:chemotaxis protein CheA [Flammeovirgaceae bacterium SG7u.111]|nr:chemotaxis protein CheA [Flammeovirgaceae bacterium SG7u.132]WPO34332.1 chemotaxis protein CheA [Flammeovirgaceae bacterium SG7u.111]